MTNGEGKRRVRPLPIWPSDMHICSYARRDQGADMKGQSCSISRCVHGHSLKTRYVWQSRISQIHREGQLRWEPQPTNISQMKPGALLHTYYTCIGNPGSASWQVHNSNRTTCHIIICIYCIYFYYKILSWLICCIDSCFYWLYSDITTEEITKTSLMW